MVDRNICSIAFQPELGSFHPIGTNGSAFHQNGVGGAEFGHHPSTFPQDDFSVSREAARGIVEAQVWRRTGKIYIFKFNGRSEGFSFDFYFPEIDKIHFFSSTRSPNEGY